MGPVRAAILTLGSLAFVAAGVFILTQDDADVGLAWGVIAFFGACALVGALQFLPKRRTIDAAAEEVVLQPSRLHFIGMAIGAMAMGVGCYFIAPLAQADGQAIKAVVGYFGAAFFGLGGLGLVWRAVNLKPIARLDRSGVHWYGPNAFTLSWREISEIGVYQVASQRFITFKSHERPTPLISPMGWSITTEGSGFAFEDVLTFATALWTRRREA